MTLTAWIVAASLLVSDSAGHHPIAPIALDGAIAIASRCSSRPMPEGCAAIVLTFGFHESGYDLQSRDPTGWTCGPFQTLASRGCPTTWEAAVDIALDFMVNSARECRGKGAPLAYYASGSCTNAAGIRISRERMREARTIVAAMPWKPEVP